MLGNASLLTILYDRAAAERLPASATGRGRGDRRHQRTIEAAAHKLEQLSDFRVSHGEAVAVGLALAAVTSALAVLAAPKNDYTRELLAAAPLAA